MSNTMTLRVAIEKARDALAESESEAKQMLQDLLDQKSEEYGTLVDECQVAVYG